MERKYFANNYGLKAQIATLENGQFCLTRYSYADMIMQNQIVEQHICDTFEDALEIINRIYRLDSKMEEVDEAAFLATFTIDRKEVFSLNTGGVAYGISLASMPCGKTQNIIIRVGRKMYYMDVNKDCDCACVEVYDYHKVRNSFSKYGANHHFVMCKPDAYLTKKFFERIAEIQIAQHIVDEFSRVVK